MSKQNPNWKERWDNACLKYCEVGFKMVLPNGSEVRSLGPDTAIQTLCYYIHSGEILDNRPIHETKESMAA